MPPKESVAYTLLSRAHSPDSTNRIYSEKIKQRPLHLRSTEPTINARNKRRLERVRKIESRHKKSKPKPLTAREKRALGLYNLDKAAQKYETYEPLHKLWIGYIQEVLFDGRKSVAVDTGSASKLCASDFHGAELEVVRSRCVSRIGVKGIVVKDSRFTFEIVTKDDGVKMVPKEHTIFRFEIPQLIIEDEDVEMEDGTPSLSTGAKNFVFELHGEQFQHRAIDRANKKFKPHHLPDL